MPRDVVLDTQGRAVEGLLHEKKLEVSQVRVGKWVEFEIPSHSKEGEIVLRQIAETLYNPLIEKYELVKL